MQSPDNSLIIEDRNMGSEVENESIEAALNKIQATIDTTSRILETYRLDTKSALERKFAIAEKTWNEKFTSLEAKINSAFKSEK